MDPRDYYTPLGPVASEVPPAPPIAVPPSGPVDITAGLGAPPPPMPPPDAPPPPPPPGQTPEQAKNAALIAGLLGKDPGAAAAAYFGPSKGAPPGPPVKPADAKTLAPFIAGAGVGEVPPTAPGTTLRGVTDKSIMDVGPIATSTPPGAPAARAGGGGGGPVNADPYGIRAAQKAMLGSYGQEADALRMGTQGQIAQNEHTSALAEELARRQEEDAAIAHAEQEQAQQHFDAQMAVAQQQLDDVREQKIDPKRMMKDTGTKVLAVVGGLIGGLYQGITKQAENPFLKDLNQAIDRDIAAQEKDIANSREGVGMQLNLLAQQRAQFKDTQTAKLQIRNMAYEAAKQQIAAEAQRYESPMVQARADQAIAQLNRQQAQLQEQLGKQLQAQAAAGAAQAVAAKKQMLEMYRTVYDKTFEKMVETYGPDAAGRVAEAEARRAVGVATFSNVGERPDYSKVTPGGGAMPPELRAKRAEAQLAVDAANKQFDAMKASPAVTNTGLGTAAASHLPQRLAPEANADAQDLEMINTQLLQAVGKVAKDADGKPNAKMIETIEKRFALQPGDTTEMKLQKIDGVRQVFNSLAAEQGATPPPQGVKHMRE